MQRITKVRCKHKFLKGTAQCKKVVKMDRWVQSPALPVLIIAVSPGPSAKPSFIGWL